MSLLFSHISLSPSLPTSLPPSLPFLPPSQVCDFTVCCPASLGKLVLIELDKQPLLLFPEDDWFCSKVVVVTPEGDKAHFPCYRWISDRELHLFREGTGQQGLISHTT